jgi:hypothetical protein
MDMESEDDSSVELEAAAEEIFMAMDQKDPKALVSALKSFIEMC